MLTGILDMSRNILLLVTGMTPQIVTETVYGLAIQSKGNMPAWVPDEIHVISTQDGLNQIRNRLLDQGNFRRLLEDYQLPDIAFSEANLYCITNAAGELLKDLKTPDDNERAADTICELVRQFTADENTSLHVSIAGGRKTMGFYAGYALSLYGREQDRMSHVLVEERFETVSDFYYPTPDTRFVTNRDGKTLDAKEAQVWLATIPFVRLRSSLAPHALVDKASFSDVVESINDLAQPVSITLNGLKQTVIIKDKICDLPPRDFAFYLWFVKRKLAGREGISRPIEGVPFDSQEYIALYEGSRDIEFNQAYFDQTKSRLQTSFKKAFGAEIAKRIMPTQADGRGGPYELTIHPDHIQLQDI